MRYDDVQVEMAGEREYRRGWRGLLYPPSPRI
jgi:hypothetical protein